MKREEIFKHIEKALVRFSNDEHRENLMQAKTNYFELTGKLNDDDHDYENRMNSFNDWYVFNSKVDTKGPAYHYVRDEKITGDRRTSFESVNYSIFEFVGYSLRKRIILKDLLHGKRIQLAKGHPELALLKDDIFVGRVMNYDDENYLLKGIRILPRSVKGILNKNCKKIRKLSDIEEETQFLLKVEGLSTKANRYSHLDPLKVFIFE